MIDLREAFIDKFNEAKRELRKTGEYQSKAYVLHPDGKWTTVEMQARMHPKTRVAAGRALCMTAGLTGATALIWIADAYVKGIKCESREEADRLVQQYRRGDLAKDPERRDCLYAVFYSPDMTFFRFQPYEHVGKTLIFDQYKEEAVDEQGFYSSLLIPWWEKQPQPASA